MPSIVKPLSIPVNITFGANTIFDATIVSVTNTGTVAEPVIVVETAGEVMVSPGATIYIEKESSHSLTSAGSAAPVFATKIAYRA
mgnify:CR=1 FL=1